RMRRLVSGARTGNLMQRIGALGNYLFLEEWQTRAMYRSKCSSTCLNKLATGDERPLADLLTPADFTDEHLVYRMQHDDLPRIKLLGVRDSHAAARQIPRDHIALNGLSVRLERRRVNGRLQRAGA